MKKLETELAKLDKEMAARRAGLIAAAGRIAEAETIAEAINNKIADPYYTTASPVVTSHENGDVNVRVLVIGNHGEARVAIPALGMAVLSEHEADKDSAVTSTITLRDFSVTIDMYCEPAAIAEAA